MPPRLLALSDVEGEYGRLRTFLKNHRVIDDKDRWIFGKGHVVCLGDMVDREIGIDAARLAVVAATDSRVAEIVIDETVVCGQLVQSVWSLAEQGWTTTVVVPAARMGEAHYALRGLPCRLQAWWEDGSTVCFGAHEIP